MPKTMITTGQKPVRFFHMADAHVGYRQYGLEARSQDFANAFAYVMNRAIVEKPDAVLLPGDVFDKDVRSADYEVFVRTLVNACQAAGVYVLGIEGNHDNKGTHQSTLKICDITPASDREEPIILQGWARVWGVDCCGHDKELLETMISHVPENVHVVMLHQMLGDVCPIASDITVDRLAELLEPKGIKYIAMGDAHNSWIYQTPHGMAVAYSGSTEMTDIDENPDKCFLDVMLHPEGKVKITQQPIPTRKIRRIAVNTDDEADALIKELKGSDMGERPALQFMSVNRAMSRRVPEIDSAAHSRNIPLYTKMHDDTTKPFEIKPFERAQTSSDLLSVVGNLHADTSEEYRLIQDILDQPHRLAEICQTYLITKGAA